MQKTITSPNKAQLGTFRFAYGLYLLLVRYLLVKGDYEWAVTNLGIALVFDPFDQRVRWSDRPLYQLQSNDQQLFLSILQQRILQAIIVR